MTMNHYLYPKYYNHLISHFHSICTFSIYRHCGARELMIRPTLYQGPGPVPRRVFAEDEQGKTEMLGAQPRMTLSSAFQDFKGKNNISLKAAPKKPPEEGASRMGSTWGYDAELVQGKYVPSALNAPTNVLTILMRKDI